MIGTGTGRGGREGGMKVGREQEVEEPRARRRTPRARRT